MNNQEKQLQRIILFTQNKEKFQDISIISMHITATLFFII